MSKIVDVLILTADAGSDIEGIVHTRTEHSKLGMRTHGAHKAAWAARQHGYTVQVVSKIHMAPEEDIINVCKQYVGPSTLIAVGTTLIAPPSFSLPKGHKEGVYRMGPTTGKIYRIIQGLQNPHNNKVLVGGSQAKAFKTLFQADYVIQGEAENEFPQLLDRIFRNGIQRKRYDWDIKDCRFRWHETDYIQPNEPLPLEASRGCIFKCKFCAFQNLGKRPGTFERPIQNIKEELEYNYERWGSTCYWLTDDTINDDNDRMNEFCDMLETLNFKIRFSGFFRMDLFHRFQKTTRRLYENGMTGVQIGVETFHPQAAKTIGKAFNGKHGKEFLRHLYYDICDQDLVVGTCNIIGLPYERFEHITETVEWYKEVGFIQPSFSPLFVRDPKRPDPSLEMVSEFSSNAKKYGYRFPREHQPAWWVNDLCRMDSDFAHGRVWSVKSKLQETMEQTMDPWMSLHYLNILKITPKEAIQIGWKKIRETVDPRVVPQGYFKQLGVDILFK